MNEAMVTIVGNVATAVQFRETEEGVANARFRLATTVRRFQPQQGTWVDAHTSFYTVWAWRTLASNLLASLSVGEPVLVQGRLRMRESTCEGRAQLQAEIEAVAVGHDLSRGASVFHRVSPAKPGLTGSEPVDTPTREGSPMS